MKVYLSLTLIIFLFAACKKENQPYSIFKETDYEVIDQEHISIDINNTYGLIIQTGYKLSIPKYYLQKNDELRIDISDSTFVSMESHGWNGREQLDFEIIRINLKFDSANFTSGDQVKIISQHSQMEAFRVFQIK